MGWIPCYAIMRGETVRYRIFNEKGAFVAEYDNESEVKTFLKASVPGAEDAEFELESGTETAVDDEKGNLRFRVMDSAPRERRAEDKPAPG